MSNSRIEKKLNRIRKPIKNNNKDENYLLLKELENKIKEKIEELKKEKKS